MRFSYAPLDWCCIDSQVTVSAAVAIAYTEWHRADYPQWVNTLPPPPTHPLPSMLDTVEWRLMTDWRPGGNFSESMLLPGRSTAIWCAIHSTLLRSVLLECRCVSYIYITRTYQLSTRDANATRGQRAYTFPVAAIRCPQYFHVLQHTHTHSIKRGA